VELGIVTGEAAGVVTNEGTQLPTRQVVPVPQTLPHAPQFALSVRVLASQPFGAIESQFANPALQVPSAQPDVAHVAPAFGNEHTVPHVRQFVVVLTGVSHPSAGRLLQSSNPAVHKPRHADATQTAVSFAAGGAHGAAHAPQFVGSFRRSRQVPLQSVRPVPQLATHAPAEQI
jgi:hypothetical protein